MSDTPQNQAPTHPEPTRSVTVSMSEWCFLLVCLIQASSKQPRAKVTARIVQQVIETPDQPLQLGFAQQDSRSITAALPIELYKAIYEQANRHAESDSQYISRMLEQALPSEIHELVNKLITELRKWSITPEKEPEQGGPSLDDLPDPKLPGPTVIEPSSNTDELAKFLANHNESPVVEVKDKSAILISASGHDHNQSIKVTELHN